MTKIMFYKVKKAIKFQRIITNFIKSDFLK